MTNEEFNVVKEECKDALEKSDTPKDFVLSLIKLLRNIRQKNKERDNDR